MGDSPAAASVGNGSQDGIGNGRGEKLVSGIGGQCLEAVIEASGQVVADLDVNSDGYEEFLQEVIIGRRHGKGCFFMRESGT